MAQRRRRLPRLAIPLTPGSTPPDFCPRCLNSPVKARKTFGPVAGNLKEYYQDKHGLRALAQCQGCMGLLVEVEEVEVS